MPDFIICSLFVVSVLASYGFPNTKISRVSFIVGICLLSYLALFGYLVFTADVPEMKEYEVTTLGHYQYVVIDGEPLNITNVSNKVFPNTVRVGLKQDRFIGLKYTGVPRWVIDDK